MWLKETTWSAEGFEDKHKDETLERRNFVSLFLAVNFQGNPLADENSILKNKEDFLPTILNYKHLFQFLQINYEVG